MVVVVVGVADSRSRRIRAAVSRAEVLVMAAEMVCQGSVEEVWRGRLVGGAVVVEGAVVIVDARRDGEADRVDVLVPIGAREEGWNKKEGLEVLPFEITTELRRRG